MEQKFKIKYGTIVTYKDRIDFYGNVAGDESYQSIEKENVFKISRDTFKTLNQSTFTIGLRMFFLPAICYVILAIISLITRIPFLKEFDGIISTIMATFMILGATIFILGGFFDGLLGLKIIHPMLSYFFGKKYQILNLENKIGTNDLNIICNQDEIDTVERFIRDELKK